MADTEKLNRMNECYSCVYKKNIAGDCHISCGNPDSQMTGSSHGIRNGWFAYPFCFDPTWKTKDCANFESVEDGAEAANG